MLQQLGDSSLHGSARGAAATAAEHRLSAPQLGIWLDWEIGPAASNYNVSEYAEANLSQHDLDRLISEIG